MASRADAPAAVTIDVISDVVCPWCFIGKRRLEQALAELPQIQATITWRPFQLDPTIPPAGLDRTVYLQNKFGSAERLDAIHQRLVAAGAAEGVPFRFDRITRSPNTLDAHRLIQSAFKTPSSSACFNAISWTDAILAIARVCRQSRQNVGWTVLW
jgi:predicted DsbA family dithiol-disulfide isomerase